MFGRHVDFDHIGEQATGCTEGQSQQSIGKWGANPMPSGVRNDDLVQAPTDRLISPPPRRSTIAQLSKERACLTLSNVQGMVVGSCAYSDRVGDQGA